MEHKLQPFAVDCSKEGTQSELLKNIGKNLPKHERKNISYIPMSFVYLLFCICRNQFFFSSQNC